MRYGEFHRCSCLRTANFLSICKLKYLRDPSRSQGCHFIVPAKEISTNQLRAMFSITAQDDKRKMGEMRVEMYIMSGALDNLIS